MAYNYKNRNRNHNNSNNRGGRTQSAQYVWQVSWWPAYGSKKYRSFTNKQQALIFMSKIKSGNNSFVSLDKYFG